MRENRWEAAILIDRAMFALLSGCLGAPPHDLSVTMAVSFGHQYLVRAIHVQETSEEGRTQANEAFATARLSLTVAAAAASLETEALVQQATPGVHVALFNIGVWPHNRRQPYALPMRSCSAASFAAARFPAFRQE